jgi:hypothetical protein
MAKQRDDSRRDRDLQDAALTGAAFIPHAAPIVAGIKIAQLLNDAQNADSDDREDRRRRRRR